MMIVETDKWICRTCKQEKDPTECEEPSMHGVRCFTCRDVAQEHRKKQKRDAERKRRATLRGDDGENLVCDTCGLKLPYRYFNEDERGRSPTCTPCVPKKAARKEDSKKAKEREAWEREQKMQEMLTTKTTSQQSES